jgi:hypothetical protein
VPWISQLLLVAVGDAEHHVVDERAGQAVQRARRARVVGALDLENTVIGLDGDRLGNDVAELALGALDLDGLAIDGDVDTRGDGDGETSDA